MRDFESLWRSGSIYATLSTQRPRKESKSHILVSIIFVSRHHAPESQLRPTHIRCILRESPFEERKKKLRINKEFPHRSLGPTRTGMPSDVTVALNFFIISLYVRRLQYNLSPYSTPSLSSE